MSENLHPLADELDDLSPRDFVGLMHAEDVGWACDHKPAAEADLKMGRKQEALDFYDRCLELAGTRAYTAEMLFSTATLAHAPLEADCLDLWWDAGAGAVLARFGSADPGPRAEEAAELLRRIGGLPRLVVLQARRVGMVDVVVDVGVVRVTRAYRKHGPGTLRNGEEL